MKGGKLDKQYIRRIIKATEYNGNFHLFATHYFKSRVDIRSVHFSSENTFSKFIFWKTFICYLVR